MMNLLADAFIQRQAARNPLGPDSLGKSSLAVLLALFSCFSLTGCSGTASNNPVPPSSGRPQLSAAPGTVSFGNVVIGTTNSQTITLTNSGTATLAISQATLYGSSFAASGLTLPLTLTPGQTTEFNVVFAPAVLGSIAGGLSLVNNAANSPATIALSGAGVAATFQLTASPTSLGFGNVAVGSSSTQTVVLTNTGNSSVSVSQINVSGAGFSTSGLTPPLTLTAGQSMVISVIFAPATLSSSTGSVTVASNASNSRATVALSGTGAQPTLHSVSLTWVPSTSLVVGYNIYRGTQSGGPYTILNSSLVLVTTSIDSTVRPNVLLRGHGC